MDVNIFIPDFFAITLYLLLISLSISYNIESLATITVTSLPIALKILANSIPTTPPPETTKCLGILSNSKISSLTIMFLFSIPFIAGISAFEPVAIIMFFPSNVTCPSFVSTKTVFLSSKKALPLIISTLFPFSNFSTPPTNSFITLFFLS